MRYRHRLVLGAGAVVAGAVVGVLSFANSGWAAPPPVHAGGSTPSPSASAEPTASAATNGPTTSPTGGSGATPSTSPTGEPTDEGPCSGGAAWDALGQSWRAWVACDDWTYVIDGSFDSRESAWQRGSDEAFIQSRSHGGNVMDGPGCDPPLVLC